MNPQRASEARSPVYEKTLQTLTALFLYASDCTTTEKRNYFPDGRLQKTLCISSTSVRPDLMYSIALYTAEITSKRLDRNKQENK